MIQTESPREQLSEDDTSAEYLHGMLEDTEDAIDLSVVIVKSKLSKYRPAIKEFERQFQQPECITAKIERFLSKGNDESLAEHKADALFILDLVCPPGKREEIISSIIEATDNVQAIQGGHRALVYFRTQVFWTSLNLVAARLLGLFPGQN